MKKETKLNARKNLIYMDALKLYNVTACLESAERLFQYFTPRNEKHFCPFTVLYNGSFKLVEVFRRV